MTAKYTSSSPDLAVVAEEIMPGAILGQIKKLGSVGHLHQPMCNTRYENEPACPDCFGGIFAVDPELARPCGCWGLLRPVCATCGIRYENGHWGRPVWPCETWKAAVTDAEASPLLRAALAVSDANYRRLETSLRKGNWNGQAAYVQELRKWLERSR